VNRIIVATAAWVLLSCLPPAVPAAELSPAWRGQLEADWMAQAVASRAGGGMTPAADAAGACDGVKDGGTGFHTESEAMPWWRVDLGAVYPLAKVLLWNRTDHADVPPRARFIRVHLSADDARWQEAYRHAGTLFYGYPKGDPLAVDLRGAAARYVKVQLANTQYLHLDEVEVFGVETGDRNLALDHPATQSSISAWSTPPRRPLPGSEPDAAFWREMSLKAMALAEATLALVERAGAPQPAARREIAALRARLEGAPAGAEPKALYLEVRWLRRSLILSHPLLDFERLLINQHPPPMISHMVDQYLGRWSRPGPGLVILSQWRDEPRAQPLLRQPLPTGSVLHPDLSFDAQRVLFSYCDHTVPELSDAEMRDCEDAMGVGGLLPLVKAAGRRRFCIYEARLDDGSIRQLTGMAADPRRTEDGRRAVLVEDFDPCYLPGGGFAFVSTRCQSFGRCHWGRYTPSFVLYRAAADGSDIRRLSYGELNEWDPAVLNDGRLLFARWDYVNRHNTFFQSLWVVRPDGTDVAHYYGNLSRNPCMTSEARAIPGSRRVVSTATAHHSYTAGSLVVIDPDRGQEGLEPLRRLTPEVQFPETEGWSEGSFATPWALSEDLFLAAYSPDRLPASWEPKNAPRPNGYGIYLIDSLGGRELVYRDPDMSSFAPIPIRPRPEPPVLPALAATAAASGTFVLQDVYRSTQPLEPGSVQALRVVRLHPQPTAGAPPRSIVGDELVKSVVGTTAVGPDGAAVFSAPAGVPLMFQLLDRNGMALLTMRTQTQVCAGEVLGCVGCHESRASTARPASGRLLGEAAPLEPPAGPRYPGGFSFVRTVQPVLDRYCIRCHGLDPKATDLSLLGTLTGGFNTAYESLVGREGLVALARANQETDASTPGEYYARRGRLAAHLLGPHQKRVVLDPESFQRLVDWLDLNGQYYGDYSWNRAERRGPVPTGEAALRQQLTARCGACHEALAAQPLAALINLAAPDQSRVVNAPLARGSGGWGLCSGVTWTRESADYRALLEAVGAVAGPDAPGDTAVGTCGQRPCRCGGCWVQRVEGQPLQAAAR
jgi:hypothetical protein